MLYLLDLDPLEKQLFINRRLAHMIQTDEQVFDNNCYGMYFPDATVKTERDYYEQSLVDVKDIILHRRFGQMSDEACANMDTERVLPQIMRELYRAELRVLKAKIEELDDPASETYDMLKKEIFQLAGLEPGELSDGSMVYGNSQQIRDWKRQWEEKHPTVELPEAASPENPRGKTPPLSKLVEQYLQEKIDQGVWVRKTQIHQQGYFNLLRQYLGDDYDLGQFDREAYVTFIREVLRKLPSNCKKKFPDKPLKEILAMSFPENKKLSAKSIKDYCTSYGQFFAWCVEIKKVMSTNPAKGFTIKLDNKSTSRRPYTDDLIAQLLGRFAARISKGGKKKEDWKSYLWVFLLGAYQGMRENEACQLFLDDVVSVDGIPALDIHAGDATQSLKTPPSRRIIPIHPVLLSLGFLRFWQEQKSLIEREKRESLNLFLFPSSEAHNYTKNFLYNFTTINKPLTQEGGQTFHCLRHTVNTRLVAAGVSGELVDYIVGHSRPAMFDRYTHLRCRDHLPHLSKMQYAINPAEILHITPCTADEIKTQTAALPVRG